MFAEIVFWYVCLGVAIAYMTKKRPEVCRPVERKGKLYIHSLADESGWVK